MGYVSNLFENWRGDIIFKLLIINTQYHKGRLRLSWDPLGDSTRNLITSVDASPVTQTQIIDLSLENTVEFRVPYNQAAPYLQVGNAHSSANNPIQFNPATPVFSNAYGFDNGAIVVRVMNALTAPILTSNIKILVSVRAADNFEFANPSNVGKDIKPWAPQCDEEILDANKSMILAKGPGLIERKGLINFGESIMSLRPLIRRTNYIQTITGNTTSTALGSAVYYVFHKMPPYPGFDPNGVDQAFGQITVASTYRYNYAHFTPLMYISLMYKAYKGSMQWHFNVNSINGLPLDDVSVTRTPGNPAPSSISTGSTIVAGTGPVGQRRQYLYARQETCTGAALTHQRTNAGISVQVPNYSPLLFNAINMTNSTNPSAITTARSYDASSLDTFQLSVLTAANSRVLDSSLPSKIEVYSGAGTDLSFYFFIHTPVLYYTTTTEPSVSPAGS